MPAGRAMSAPTGAAAGLTEMAGTARTGGLVMDAASADDRVAVPGADPAEPPMLAVPAGRVTQRAAQM